MTTPIYYLPGETKQYHSNGKLSRNTLWKNNRQHGECKQWYYNGQIEECVNYKNGRLHGEVKEWNLKGYLVGHSFWADNTCITEHVKNIVDDINNITHEENVLIKLTFGV